MPAPRKSRGPTGRARGATAKHRDSGRRGGSSGRRGGRGGGRRPGHRAYTASAPPPSVNTTCATCLSTGNSQYATQSRCRCHNCGCTLGTGDLRAFAQKRKAEELSVPARLAALFSASSTVPLQGHHEALHTHGEEAYLSGLHQVLEGGVVPTAATKGRVLATLWGARLLDEADALLADRTFDAGVVDVVKAVQLLDAPRRVRQLRRKRAQLAARAAADEASVRPSTIAKLDTTIHNLCQDAVAHTVASEEGGEDGDAPGAHGPASASAPAGGATSSIVTGGRVASAEVMERLAAPVATFTSATAQRVRKWTRSISADALVFTLLSRPLDPFRDLADVAHLRPSDFALPYFLPAAFGTPLPDDCVVARLRALVTGPEADEGAAKGATTAGAGVDRGAGAGAASGAGRRARSFDAAASARLVAALDDAELSPFLCDMYAWVRTAFKLDTLSVGCRGKLAARIPLEDALWHYEELRGAARHDTAKVKLHPVDDAITRRLDSGERIDTTRGRANFGKLLERTLSFLDMGVPFAERLVAHAEQRLDELRAAHRGGVGHGAGAAAAGVDVKGEVAPAAAPARIVTIGDASASMQVAVRAASILAGLLSAVLDSDLTFFNSAIVPPPVVPRTAADVLRVAREVAARGGTAPAAALKPFYERREKVALFVVVTDEEENREVPVVLPTRTLGKRELRNHSFAALFKRYRDEVNPAARCFFVSFLRNGVYGARQGLMATALNKLAIDAPTFTFSPTKPDLSKFSKLLGQVLLELQAQSRGPRLGAVGAGAAGPAESKAGEREAAEGGGASKTEVGAAAARKGASAAAVGPVKVKIGGGGGDASSANPADDGASVASSVSATDPADGSAATAAVPAPAPTAAPAAPLSYAAAVRAPARSAPAPQQAP